MIIPINLNKKLCDYQIELIRTELKKMAWIYEVYPAVKVMTRNDGATYPGVYVDSGQVKTLDLTPFTNQKAFGFFEKRGYTIADQLGLNNNYDLSLVFWCNLQAISVSKTYDFTDELINEVNQVLWKFRADNINVSLENTFSRYSLYDTQKQLFMYPFTSFKIDFSILAKSCI